MHIALKDYDTHVSSWQQLRLLKMSAVAATDLRNFLCDEGVQSHSQPTVATFFAVHTCNVIHCEYLQRLGQSGIATVFASEVAHVRQSWSCTSVAATVALGLLRPE